MLGTSALLTTIWGVQHHTSTTSDQAALTAEIATAQANKFKDPDAPAKHQDPELQGPGYYQQWFDMRKDENNELPRGQRKRWYAHDRMQLALYSGARNGSPIQSTAFMGPTNVGGRTRALLVDRSNGRRIFAGGMSGGLWKSNDAGNTWAPINDAASSLAVSSITQSPFNANIIYYGTGESRANSAGVPGDGVWKSTNGGNSFFQLSSTAFNSHFDRIWKIEHGKQASKPNTIYVGTNEGGLYRSENGGSSWVRVHSSPRQVNDIVTFSDGGVMIACYGSGIYYSPNGNSGTFTKQTSTALPTSGVKRIEIEHCAGRQNTVYAMFENSSQNGIGAFVRTTNRGTSWTAQTTPNTGNTYYRYCMMLGVHATDPSKVIVGASSSSFKYSTNGGASWATGAHTHADYHIVANNAQNPNEFYVGNDGGVFRCNWNNIWNDVDVNRGYHTTQFYAGFYTVSGIQAVGGTQDNGTHRVGGIQSKVAGGDGGPAFINLQATDGTGYQSYQNGETYRRTNMASGNGSAYNIATNTMKNEGVSFIHPYTINRKNGSHVFYPTRKGLWASTNGGTNFIKLAGGSSNIATFYAIEAGPAANPSVYYGGSGGRLYRINNAATATAGSGHTQLNLPLAVRSRTISGITAVSNSEIYVSFSTMSNFPHVWKVINANTSNPIWYNISGNLPSTLPINRVAVDPANKNHLFAASDFGLYYSSNGGRTWLKHTAIPNVAIFEVHFRASDSQLFVFTHGRGVWRCTATSAVTTTVQVRARSVWSNCCPRLRVSSMVNSQYLDNMYNPVLQSATFPSVGSSWTTYTVIFSGNIPANRIRVYFDNDARSRDLDVDWIRINNVTYQSEDAYSTGTWSYRVGCSDGFKGQQRLHCNGYFHYNVRPGNNSSPDNSDNAGSPTPLHVDEAAIFAPQLFPNPVQDRVYVSNQLGQIEQVHLALYNLNGQLLVERPNVVLSAGTDAAESLDVSTLSSGLYVLSITTQDGQRQVLKFTKQ